jgi:hypothetical protein
MTKLHFRLSSTALGKSGCIKNITLSTIKGYRSPLMHPRIVYGIAIHKFIHIAYQTGGDIVKAIDAGKRAFNLPKCSGNKNQGHLEDVNHFLGTCLNLWAGFIQEDTNFEIISINGVPQTERTFCVKFYEDDYIIVTLEGTLDKLGHFDRGCYAVGDWKSTSAWDNEGYFEQYELSRQLRLYNLACKIEAEIDSESTLGRIGSTNMGCFIDAIFLKPNFNDNKVIRSRVFQFPKDDIQHFRGLLLSYCHELSFKVQGGLLMSKEGIRNGSCEGKWGKCAFWNVCQANSNVEELLLKRDFIVREFNPQDYNGLGED